MKAKRIEALENKYHGLAIRVGALETELTLDEKVVEDKDCGGSDLSFVERLMPYYYKPADSKDAIAFAFLIRDGDEIFKGGEKVESGNMFVIQYLKGHPYIYSEKEFDRHFKSVPHDLSVTARRTSLLTSFMEHLLVKQGSGVVFHI